jgi:ornithine cyclodeaminase/alanine dehydrogenase-like protein (mu-crystallin family)
MYLLAESTASLCTDLGAVVAAVEQAFRELSRGNATNLPVVCESLDHAGPIFGVKAGFSASNQILGLKAGGYWPENRRLDSLEYLRVPIEYGDLLQICRNTSVIVTATSAASPVFALDQVRAGAHIICIGADTVEKRELHPINASRIRPFTDVIAQSITIGEFQHVRNLDLDARSALCELGDVITGHAPGRQSDDDITLFDSTGMALQDLFVAYEILRTAQARDLISHVDTQLAAARQP